MNVDENIFDCFTWFEYLFFDLYIYIATLMLSLSIGKPVASVRKS